MTTKSKVSTSSHKSRVSAIIAAADNKVRIKALIAGNDRRHVIADLRKLLDEIDQESKSDEEMELSALDDWAETLGNVIATLELLDLDGAI
jgi:hypothetical protein